MPASLRIAYLAHSLRSDWNNGNAHFLRGLMRALMQEGHEVTGFEADGNWSVENLRNETGGEQSLVQFRKVYSDLRIKLYRIGDSEESWRDRLRHFDVVVLHEWNPPELAGMLLKLRASLGYSLLFHDTHHRATSSPDQIEHFGLEKFDGVLAFGEALRVLYRERYGLRNVWTLHEAADTTYFKPESLPEKMLDVVWVGNWGEGERTRELKEYLLAPLRDLGPKMRAEIYGVRYPEDGLAALKESGVTYGGYLPNLQSPGVYAKARLTVHVPRQQYTTAMRGIPTIRVFEALACGIPLLSAPWEDTEGLFAQGDFWMVKDGSEMLTAMRTLLADPARAAEQAQRGLATVRARHTCAHRAAELTGILEEVRS